MEALLTSVGVVALAEIGDKTQLLAILLAARFRAPLPIIAGIFCATILNHAAAATLGYWAGQFLHGKTFHYLVGAGFVVMAAWTLIPDKQEDLKAESKAGVFVTTLISFFLVEIGDKTQIATSLLAARFHDIALVAVGTTIGMMLANVPAVFAGEAITKLVPLRYVRWTAAALFAILGVVVIATAA
jgi:Ca2+/H+ antiporter, TMEM165/GDT1 family